MPSRNSHIVLDYPYENAICLFLTQHLDPDFYKRIETVSGGYYGFLASKVPKSATKIALDLAILYDTIHVHPIDLPIYEGQDIVKPSRYRDSTNLEIFNVAQETDLMDEGYKRLVQQFRTRYKSLIAQRVNWHLLDSYNYDAPIFSSPKLSKLYNHKFGRACFQQKEGTVENYLEVYRTMESVVGISFKIETLDQLNTIRKDPDIVNFRRKLFEFKEALKEDPDKVQIIRREIEEAIDQIKEIERFNKATSLMSCVTLPLSLALLFLGPLPTAATLVKIVPSIGSTSINIWNRLRKRKYSWVLLMSKIR